MIHSPVIFPGIGQKKYSPFFRKKFPLFGFIAFLFFLSIVLWFYPHKSFAGVHDGSDSRFRSRIIDHSLTPHRINIIEDRIINSGGSDEVSKNRLQKYSESTIFWRGRVEKFNKHPGYYWMFIKPDKGRSFWVLADAGIRNLDFDRTSYTVGVKGSMIIKDNRLSFVKARSVVLVAPPDEMSFAKFKASYNLRDNFVMNTGEGKVTIKNKYYPFVLHRIYCHNPHYEWEEIQKIAKSVIFYANRYNVDPLLLTALINIESAFDTDAVSSTGAIGLGQLMPGTAASLGVDPNNTVQNVGGTARYLHYQLRRWQSYRNAVPMALASYNAGPGAVSSYGGVPPYSETQNYVFFITFLIKEYEKQFDEKYESTADR